MDEVTPIRVVLVDDHQHIHDAVISLLKTVDDIRLVGQAYQGDDALQICQLATPDLVLMDVVMPGLNGSQATRALLKQNPAVRVLALSSYSEYEHIKDMLDSGATGYLVKNAIAEDLINTIRATHRGNTVLSPEVTRTLFAPPSDHPPDFELTDRELQVLKLMAQGQTNGQIALALGITQPTVRFHINNILLKLKVDTRSEALVIAGKHHLA
jgi:NarL family two-component system response regulator LiaR